MKGLNKVSLIGNLGDEVDFKILEGNIAVSKFSLATTEMFKDKNGKLASETDWHQIVVWRNMAEFAQKYLKKGSLVYIEGKLKNRQFEDRNGIKRYVTEIMAEDIILLDKKVN